jgi:hypothetical protein
MLRLRTRAVRAGVPRVIGSAGTSGSDAGLAWMVDIVREIAREHGLPFNLAIIESGAVRTATAAAPHSRILAMCQTTAGA